MLNTITALAAQDAREVALDADLPGWEQDERRAFGEVLGERDFPVFEDTDAVSDEDWAWFFEATYVDPAERGW